MKQCLRCKKTKPLSKFRARADGEGFYAFCSHCTTRQERYQVVSPPDADIDRTMEIRGKRPLYEVLREAI